MDTPPGNQVLREVADCCRAHLWEADILGRYGGQEFLLLLSDISLSAVVRVVERV